MGWIEARRVERGAARTGSIVANHEDSSALASGVLDSQLIPDQQRDLDEGQHHDCHNRNHDRRLHSG